MWRTAYGVCTAYVYATTGCRWLSLLLFLSPARIVEISSRWSSFIWINNMEWIYRATNKRICSVIRDELRVNVKCRSSRRFRPLCAEKSDMIKIELLPDQTWQCSRQLLFIAWLLHVRYTNKVFAGHKLCGGILRWHIVNGVLGHSYSAKLHYPC